MRRADGCEAWSSEPPGLVPPHRGQAMASAGEAAVKDAEGAAQRGVGEPKCAAFWGDRASLTLGRAACSEMGCHTVKNSVVVVSLNKNTKDRQLLTREYKP